jgi:hypothetical protein
VGRETGSRGKGGGGRRRGKEGGKGGEKEGGRGEREPKQVNLTLSSQLIAPKTIQNPHTIPVVSSWTSDTSHRTCCRGCSIVERGGNRASLCTTCAVF